MHLCTLNGGIVRIVVILCSYSDGILCISVLQTICDIKKNTFVLHYWDFIDLVIVQAIFEFYKKYPLQEPLELRDLTLGSGTLLTHEH